MIGRRTVITRSVRRRRTGNTTLRASVAGLAVLALVGAALTWHATRANTAGGSAPAASPGIAASASADLASGAAPEPRPASGSSTTTPAVTAAQPAIDPRSGGALSQSTPVEEDAGTRLKVPYRSQFDGSTFEWGNCGVSAISMAMEYYGRTFSTHDVRLSINQLTGNWDRQIGVDWRYLRIALEQRGFSTRGPYAERSGYISWTLEDVLAQVEQGRPVMLMAHYRSLPGHEEDEWIGDHYLLVLGQTRDGQIVYHDPGFEGDRGAYMTIDRGRLERAWSNTWIGQNRTAMVILPAE